jgi:hypothetical protein
MFWPWRTKPSEPPAEAIRGLLPEAYGHVYLLQRELFGAAAEPWSDWLRFFEESGSGGFTLWRDRKLLGYVLYCEGECGCGPYVYVSELAEAEDGVVLRLLKHLQSIYEPAGVMLYSDVADDALASHLVLRAAGFKAVKVVRHGEWDRYIFAYGVGKLCCQLARDNAACSSAMAARRRSMTPTFRRSVFTWATRAIAQGDPAPSLRLTIARAACACRLAHSGWPATAAAAAREVQRHWVHLNPRSRSRVHPDVRPRSRGRVPLPQ